MEDIKKHGVDVVGRIPVLVEITEHNKDYMRTKMEKFGHMLDDLFVEDEAKE
jgi:GTP cyclohydrolase II